MNKVRFRYSKTGKARYISHLDLMATMQRAFLRAGIKLKYSEGFNPHPCMSVAIPLSVGCESICELMDVAIIDGIIPDISGIELPCGIIIHNAYMPDHKFNEISWIEIQSKMYYDAQITDSLTNKLSKCFSKNSIVISKRTKRGFKDIDIAQLIKNVDFKLDGCIIMTAKVSAQNPTLNAVDLENVLENGLKPDYTDIKRIDFYDKDMITFR